MGVADSSGRLLFQVLDVAVLPKPNVTDDVRATSPADCARQCHEQSNCQLAGFIPNPIGVPGGSGICLLTQDVGICRPSRPAKVAQHSSAVPFVISCIEPSCKPLIQLKINMLFLELWVAPTYYLILSHVVVAVKKVLSISS